MGAAEMNRSGSCASRGSGGRFCSIDTIAPAPAKPTAPWARIVIPHLAGVKGLRQHRRSADQHRRQHGGRRAQVEQRHRGPQHLSRAEFPCRRDGRGHREQVMPCRGDRFRRSGRARREEQRPDVAATVRRLPPAGSRRRALSAVVRVNHPAPQQSVTVSSSVGDLVDPGAPLGVGEDHLGPRQAEARAAGSRPCSRRSPRRSPRRCAPRPARSTPTPGTWR